MEALFAQLLDSVDLTQVLAVFASSDEDGVGAVLLLLLGGPAFFMFTYMRYRNTDKRHRHEIETPAEMNNLQQYNNFIKHLTRQSSSTITGANDNVVSGSLLSNGGASKSFKAINDITKNFK